MLVGKYQGKKIQDVKKAFQKDLVDSGEAIIYYEPEKQIISRLADVQYLLQLNESFISNINRIKTIKPTFKIPFMIELIQKTGSNLSFNNSLQ